MYVRLGGIADRVSDLICVAHQSLLMPRLLAVLLAGSFWLHHNLESQFAHSLLYSPKLLHQPAPAHRIIHLEVLNLHPAVRD